MSKPTPTSVSLDNALLQMISVRPELGTFIRKVYDLIAELQINGKGYSTTLQGDDLVIRLKLQ